MRATRVAFLPLIGTAALAFGAPAALAVTHSVIAPGGIATLSATECEAPTVTASSSVFDTVTLDGGRSAPAQVFEDAKPGAEYEVAFDCEGEKGTTSLTTTSLTATVGSGSDTAAGAGAESVAGTEPSTGTEPDVGTEPSTGTEPDVGTEPSTETEADVGTEAIGSEPSTETGAVTGTEAGTETGARTTKPGGGVRAGAGGSLSELSPAQITAGAVLVAGALGGGVLLLLRQRTGPRGWRGRGWGQSGSATPRT